MTENIGHLFTLRKHTDDVNFTFRYEIDNFHRFEIHSNNYIKLILADGYDNCNTEEKEILGINNIIKAMELRIRFNQDFYNKILLIKTKDLELDRSDIQEYIDSIPKTEFNNFLKEASL